MEQFIERILNGKKSKVEVVDQLYKLPQKDIEGDAPNIPIIDPNYAQYIDILYLPNDQGKKYCLVIVDQGSRYVGACAMEDRKVDDVIRAMRTIYRVYNKWLKYPVVIISDKGSEFLKNFDEKILQSFGIEHHKILKPGRSRSNLAERKNQTIGKIISRVLTQVQITSGKPSSRWVSYLPMIINKINEKVQEQDLKPISFEDSQPITFDSNKKIDMLNVGDDVRVMLDKPIDVANNKLHGSFRTGDIRWNPEIRTVRLITSKPNQPFLYYLNGSEKMDDVYVEKVGYTRNQLQKVSTRERNPENQTPLFENDIDREEIQNITERGLNEDNIMMYKVKFKKVRKPVWISKENLIKELGKSFMQSLDKKFDKK